VVEHGVEQLVLVVAGQRLEEIAVADVARCEACAVGVDVGDEVF